MFLERAPQIGIAFLHWSDKLTSYSCRRKATILLVGLNGAGKTTILSNLTGGDPLPKNVLFICVFLQQQTVLTTLCQPMGSPGLTCACPDMTCLCMTWEAATVSETSGGNIMLRLLYFIKKM